MNGQTESLFTWVLDLPAGRQVLGVSCWIFSFAFLPMAWRILVDQSLEFLAVDGGHGAAETGGVGRRKVGVRALVAAVFRDGSSIVWHGRPRLCPSAAFLHTRGRVCHT